MIEEVKSLEGLTILESECLRDVSGDIFIRMKVSDGRTFHVYFSKGYAFVETP